MEDSGGHRTATPRAASVVGVWSGVARYEGRSDEITLSFADDGTVALRTERSIGRGTWSADGQDRFTYRLSERLTGPPAPGGHVTIDVLARLEGETTDGRPAAYRGESTATVHDPGGAVVHTVAAEVTARRQAGAPAAWHRAD